LSSSSFIYYSPFSTYLPSHHKKQLHQHDFEAQKHLHCCRNFFLAADAVGFVVFCDVVCIAVVVVIFTFVDVFAFVVVFASFVVIVVDRPNPVLTGHCLC
jgi:hypothetical protein